MPRAAEDQPGRKSPTTPHRLDESGARLGRIYELGNHHAGRRPRFSKRQMNIMEIEKDFEHGFVAFVDCFLCAESDFSPWQNWPRRVGLVCLNLRRSTYGLKHSRRNRLVPLDVQAYGRKPVRDANNRGADVRAVGDASDHARGPNRATSAPKYRLGRSNQGRHRGARARSPQEEFFGTTGNGGAEAGEFLRPSRMPAHVFGRDARDGRDVVEFLNLRLQKISGHDFFELQRHAFVTIPSEEITARHPVLGRFASNAGRYPSRQRHLRALSRDL
jgi:hypothetical protein